MILRKTLSIMLVLGLVIGGIPLFFSTSAEAATSVHESRQGANDVWHSNGYLHVDVSQFEEEGGYIIPGYVMLIEYDFCRKDLNPFGSFLGTVREHRTATIITDQKGEASFEFDIPNMCWTENAWLTGASDSWQSINYYLGQMASTSLSLDIRIQPIGASQYAEQRADTLGLIQNWYNLDDYQYGLTGTAPPHIGIKGSHQVIGSTKLAISYTAPCASTSQGNQAGYSSMTASAGTFKDIINGPSEYVTLRSERTETYAYGDGSFTLENIQKNFGPGATLSGGVAKGHITSYGGTEASPHVTSISNATLYGPVFQLRLYGDSDLSGPEQHNMRMQVWVDGVLMLPEAGGWLTGSAGTYDFTVIDWAYGTHTIELKVYYVNGSNYGHAMRMQLSCPRVVGGVLSGLSEADKSTTISLGGDLSATIDLSGRWNKAQISGYSSTLTDQFVVPVQAYIKGVYPLVISNPRFDRTPIADANNDLRFDVYNIKDSVSTETINLALTTDNGTQVWATTVGSQIYPAWAGESKFTSIHLTNVYIAAEPRRQYTLTIESGGALTEIPVVFYPAELDPDTVYGPKDDLDEIVDAYSKVSPAALKAYYDWAVGMELRNKEMQSIIGNYTKIFEDPDAVSSLESAQAASDRAKEMIAQIKVICKGDGTDTNIGELKTLGNGIWSSYLAALMYREAAVAYEAGQDAFGNSTALDAWYADLISKRIKTGMQDEQEKEDARSSAGWIALGVALLAGGVASYLVWSKADLKRYMPKPRGSPWMRLMIRWAPLIIAIVVGIIVAVIAFMISLEVVAAIEGALAGLGEMFG